jgi:phosphinothricin acetyltransferase
VRGEDAESVADIYGPHCSVGYASFETEAPTLSEIARRIADISAVYPWLVFEIDGQVAGYAYASLHRARSAYQWAVDVTVYVAPGFHRQGIAGSLYDRLLPMLADLGYFKAYAGIALPNDASVGFHQSKGFDWVGIYKGVGYKHGEWRDVGWLQLAIQPEQSEPSVPRSVSELFPTQSMIEVVP